MRLAVFLMSKPQVLFRNVECEPNLDGEIFLNQTAPIQRPVLLVVDRPF